jgi:hypothetical protein
MVDCLAANLEAKLVVLSVARLGSRLVEQTVGLMVVNLADSLDTNLVGGMEWKMVEKLVNHSVARSE